MLNMFDQLKEEFPREAISWRAQNVTKDGTKAMALAYIDARDVMDRLDDVCGVSGWQCKYPHANGKTVCEIGILCDTKNGLEWVWKSDGAGDSDIEAEKGALSDAFKRAAVRWGVGRYLYHLASPWVPCESYKAGDKYKFSKFTADPWDFVAGAVKTKPHFKNAAMRNKFCAEIVGHYEKARTKVELADIAGAYKDITTAMEATGHDHELLAVESLRNHYTINRKRLDAENAAGTDADIARLKGYPPEPPTSYENGI